MFSGECRIEFRKPYDRTIEPDHILDRASDIVCVITQGLTWDEVRKTPAYDLYDRMCLRRLAKILERARDI